MQINWTEQLGRAGPSRTRTARKLTHTHTLTQKTQDRNAVKHRTPSPLECKLTSLQKNDGRSQLAGDASHSCDVPPTVAPVYRRFVFVVFCLSPTPALQAARIDPTPMSSYPSHPPRPQAPPSQKGKHTEDRASILTCQKHRFEKELYLFHFNISLFLKISLWSLTSVRLANCKGTAGSLTHALTHSHPPPPTN